jgi:hypothetical protein
MDSTLMIEENNGHPIGFVAGFSFLSYFEEERFHCDDCCLVFCHNRRIKFHHCYGIFKKLSLVRAFEQVTFSFCFRVATVMEFTWSGHTCFQI